MNVPDPRNFDLVVLGGGPAGTSGAAAAGLLGRNVALVEMAALIGGAGINTGTIPSRTLRETSLMLSRWRSRRLLGVDLSLRREATIADFMRHEKQVKDSERERIEARLAKRGVTHLPPRGKFRGRAESLVTSDPKIGLTSRCGQVKGETR